MDMVKLELVFEEGRERVNAFQVGEFLTSISWLYAAALEVVSAEDTWNDLTKFVFGT